MIYQVREGGAVPVRVPQHRWPGVGGPPLWVFRALEANAEGGFVKAECPLYDSRTHGLTGLLGAPYTLHVASGTLCESHPGGSEGRPKIHDSNQGLLLG